MILRSGKWPVKKLSLAVTFCFYEFLRGFEFFRVSFSASLSLSLSKSKETFCSLSYLVPDGVLLRHELDDAVDEEEGEAELDWKKEKERESEQRG